MEPIKETINVFYYIQLAVVTATALSVTVIVVFGMRRFLSESVSALRDVSRSYGTTVAEFSASLAAQTRTTEEVTRTFQQATSQQAQTVSDVMGKLSQAMTEYGAAMIRITDTVIVSSKENTGVVSQTVEKFNNAMAVYTTTLARLSLDNLQILIVDLRDKLAKAQPVLDDVNNLDRVKKRSEQVYALVAKFARGDINEAELAAGISSSGPDVPRSPPE